MQQTNPKVTVCMPNYNYGRFIGEAIQSVLEQDFSEFELVIVDDASTDDSDQTGPARMPPRRRNAGQATWRR